METHVIIDDVRAIMRDMRFSTNTQQSYSYWINRFLHHEGRPLGELGECEIRSFLAALSGESGISASTWNLALNAILFLYRSVLDRPIDSMGRAMRIRRTQRPPVVFTREEVAAVIEQLSGVNRLMAALLYGSGLRLMECLSLRVGDIDFANGAVIVRGERERRTILPEVLHEPLREQLRRVRTLHLLDLEEGGGVVELPDFGAYGCDGSTCDWRWQYVFPASHRTVEVRTSILRRGHIDESVLQRAVKRAVRASAIGKSGSPSTFRHSFAAHLIEEGHDVRTVQELLGHGDIRTTMLYKRIVSRPTALRSPLDSVPFDVEVEE